MKRSLKIITFFLLIALVGIQFIPTKRNQSNEVLTSDFMQVYQVPKKIEKMLKTSCYDCHSNNTDYPWYNKIQPISYFLEQHISEGKEELNFNEFGLYSKRRRRNKLRAITSQIKKGMMPLETYTIIHNEAKLSEKEKIVIEEWIDNILIK
ncbi:MAG: heme-binding domain-containing protein [Flavobacteriales bacterium]|nr:heme-binding domain-containing protein [Flavobacteriales bacterium]